MTRDTCAVVWHPGETGRLEQHMLRVIDHEDSETRTEADDLADDEAMFLGNHIDVTDETRHAKTVDLDRECGAGAIYTFALFVAGFLVGLGIGGALF